MTQTALRPEDEFRQLLLSKLPPTIARKDVERQLGGIITPCQCRLIGGWPFGGLPGWPECRVPHRIPCELADRYDGRIKAKKQHQRALGGFRL